jgi:hypothetical protein
MNSPAPCPFCIRIASAHAFQQDGTALALPDAFPLNPGHTLVIPRYRGDVPDPRGGVRWVVPACAPHWKDSQ